MNPVFMSKVIIRTILFAISLIVIIHARLLSASGIDEMDKHFKNIKNELEIELKELDIVESTKMNMAKELSLLEDKLMLGKNELIGLETKHKKLLKDKIKIKRESKHVLLNMGIMKEQLYNSNLYLLDNQNMVNTKTLFFTKAYHNVLKNLEILEHINVSVYEKVELYQNNIEKLKKLQKSFDDQLLQINLVSNQKRRVLNQYNNEKIRYDHTFAIVMEDESSKKDYINILQGKQTELEYKIRELEKQKVAAEANNIFLKYKGRLPWPLWGNIIERYGPRAPAGFNGTIFNKGIKIKAVADSVVKSIFKGKVEYMNWVRGYGNIIIIRHDNTYYSLYANLDTVYVDTGENIQQGDAVGLINDIEDTKSYLYFEIREHEKAVNPQEWLKEYGGFNENI